MMCYPSLMMATMMSTMMSRRRRRMLDVETTLTVSRQR